MMEKQRGDGRIFKRGNVFWIQYNQRGKMFRESAKTKDENTAIRFLRKRLSEISVGVFKGPKVEKTTFEEMAKDIVNDYKVNGRQSADKIDLRLSHLREVFGLARMIDISTDRIKAYIVRRQEEEAANATINRELACLKRMFTLGLQSGKLAGKPYIPSLREMNVRKGFFEHEDFIRLKKHLSEYLQPLVTFAYYSGWRSEEIRSLRWNQVDLKNGCVRLEVGETKNDDGRVLFLTPEIKELLFDMWNKRRLDCPFVFNREGKYIVSFRTAWESACKKAKLPGMLFHDFRRTAVRNMVRAGIPERVSMQISGHKTRSVFDRYHIVSESDLIEAALKSAQFSKVQAESEKKVVSLPVTGKN